MWKDVAYLPEETQTTNEIGDLITVSVYTKEIYCDKQSVRSTEFYQAHAVGKKVEIVLVAKLVDFNEEDSIKFEDQVYNIFRTYPKGDDIELVLTRGVNNASA